MSETFDALDAAERGLTGEEFGGKYTLTEENGTAVFFFNVYFHCVGEVLFLSL